MQHLANMDGFSRYGSGSYPDIIKKLMKFLRMSFPEIGPAHATEIENSEKLAKFFRNLPGKLKFRKNFCMSFPGFANKG